MVHGSCTGPSAKGKLHTKRLVVQSLLCIQTEQSTPLLHGPAGVLARAKALQMMLGPTYYNTIFQFYHSL